MKTWKQSTFFGFLAILAFAFTACPPDGNNDNGSTHTHDFGTVWKINATQHWHECSCGEKSDIANHTWDWEITAPATTETEGLKTEKCTVCGATSGNTQSIEKLPLIYTVTIDELTNGSIIANPITGAVATEITLTINPDDLYRLKAGTLKYGSTVINEATLKFNLPAADVTVTAQFESLFIGTWLLDNGTIWIFSENTMEVQLNYGGSTSAIWFTDGLDKIVLTAGDTTVIYIFEFITNSSFKIKPSTGGAEIVCTLQ